MRSEEQLFETAVRYHRSGALDRAEKLYRALLESAPEHFEIRRLLGVLLLQRGSLDEAIAMLRSAIATRPDAASGHCNLGSALRAKGQLGDARAAFQRAVELDSGLAEAHNNLASIALLEGDLDGATAAYRRAVEIDPAAAIPRTNLAASLLQAGHAREALEHATRALERAPELAEAGKVHALSLAANRRIEEAMAAFGELEETGRMDAEALHHYGVLLDEAGRWDDALDRQRQALELAPDHGAALSDALFLTRRLCRWEDHGRLFDRFRTLLKQGASGLKPFTLLSEWSTPAEQRRCARLWARRFDTDATPPALRAGEGAITVGYLSSGFHQHPTACLTAELFERHHRGGFRWNGYSVGPDDGSEMRRRISAAFDLFRDFRGKSYRQMVDAIGGDGVDILVDLRGYGGGAVTEVFGARAAPIQVNWLAYPGTMGAPFMDYIVVDRHVAPPEVAEYLDEAPVYLPHSYQPSDSTRDFGDRIPTRAECGLPDEGVVFCSFNNSYKISEKLFDRWMAVLKQVPGSVLWLLEGKAGTSLTGNLRSQARQRGIDPDRLIFMTKQPHLDYLARLHLADLFLDTLPYNAHTTASDALWAGCPVLTCIGDTFAGRVAASLCRSAGLEQLVVDTLDDYEKLGVALATSERQRLQEITRRLRGERDELPLFQTEQLATALEQAYGLMVESARAGRPPAPITLFSSY